MPEKFENAALFLRLGQLSTLIRHENETFLKRWRHDNHVISLTEFSSNTNPKW